MFNPLQKYLWYENMPIGVTIHNLVSKDKGNILPVFEWANNKFSEFTGIGISDKLAFNFFEILNSSAKSNIEISYPEVLKNNKDKNTFTCFFYKVRKWIKIEYTINPDNQLVLFFHEISGQNKSGNNELCAIELLNLFKNNQSVDTTITKAEGIIKKYSLAQDVKINLNHISERSNNQGVSKSETVTLEHAGVKLGNLSLNWANDGVNEQPCLDFIKNISTLISIWIKDQITSKRVLDIESRLNGFLNLAEYGFFVFDKQFNFIDFNRKMTELSGFGDDDFSRAGVSNSNFIDFKNEIIQSVNKGKDYFEVSLKQKNNSKKYFRILGTELPNGNYLGLMKDISDDKLITRELLKAKVRAEKASRAKSEFLANMSHEIRTPLNGVIGFTDLLMNTSLSEIQTQYLQNVDASAKILIGLINNILDFSKIEAGKLDLIPEKTDLQDLVETVAEVVRYNAHNKGLELIININGKLPQEVIVDQLRLKQVLVNLVANAIKFTDCGEVELALHASSTETEGVMQFHFSVRDTGIGISDDDKKKLFMAFSQADNLTNRIYSGTGLGLVISSMLVEKMGGKISIESEPRVGSVFSFGIKLPVIVADYHPMQVTKNIKRALVVDDNPLTGRIIGKMLKGFGVEPAYAKDIIEALNLIEISKEFDLIIIEFDLPNIKGLDVLKTIQSISAKRLKKQEYLMLFSTVDNSTLFDDCVKHNVNYKLIKPVKQSELSKIIFSADELFNNTVKPGKTNETTGKIIDCSGYPITILIAEDDDINMMLTVEIVAQSFPNANIIKASNGNMAIEQYKIFKPNLVLMDINMPFLNGLDAAGKIRKIEKELLYSPVPIIALTTNVNNDSMAIDNNPVITNYLTKPLNKDLFIEVLQNHICIINKIQGPENLIQIESDVNGHFNQSELMHRLAGKGVIFERLVESALHGIPNYFNQIRKAIEEDEIQKVSGIAHTLKGASATLCFHKLEKMAHELEKMDPDKHLYVAHLKRLEVEFEIVKKLIV